MSREWGAHTYHALSMNLSNARAIKGWMSDKELEWLATRARHCTNIVEFGCYLGRSTRVLADNSPDNCKIYAVDPWNGEYFNEDGSPNNLFSLDDFRQFNQNLRDHIETGKVIQYMAFSQSFPENLVQSDLTFLDGDHRYESVLQDIRKAFIITKQGGIIAGHDYGRNDWPGVKRAVNSMFNLPSVNLIETLWWVQL